MMKTMRFFSTSLFLMVLLHAGISANGYAQVTAPGYNAYDMGTMQSLDQLRRQALSGNRVEVDQKIQEIVKSSGYIKPLAEIYYRLALNEKDVELALKDYTLIVQNWADSAWAQKAVVDAVPLILMSQGLYGQELVSLFGKHEKTLTAAANDAPMIGESAQLLAAEVRIHLINLAHYQNDPARVLALTQGASDTRDRDLAELAQAYAVLRLERFDDAKILLEQWFRKYPDSNYRPFALLAFYRMAKNQQERQDSILRISERYPHSLETAITRKNTGAQP